MKKKICFIVSSPSTAKSFLENHFEVLSNDFDIYLVANFDGEKYQNRNLKGVKHIPIFRKINLLQDTKALWSLSKYLRKNKFDAIITFTPKAGLIGIVAGKLAGIDKRIHFFTGQVWHTKKGIFKTFLKSLDKVVVAFCTNIIVDGRPQQKFLIENKILNKENSIVIGKGTISGIDLEKFSSKPDVREKLRSSFGFDDSNFVVLFLGRLNYDKGIVELLKAFELFSKKYANARLVLIGPDEENIADLIETNPNPNVCLFGSTDRPFDYMQICDVFCLPSHREAFGLSIIEASACGKAILCSDTYGLSDTIIEGKTGLRHITHDSESIFDNLNILIENKELRDSLGLNGRKYTEEFFSKETVTQLWVEYFMKIFKKV